MDSESASASGSVQRLAAERKGFFGRMRDKLDETNEVSSLGDAKSSLGDAESSLGDAKSSAG
jgi:hypothetical protein